MHIHLVMYIWVFPTFEFNRLLSFSLFPSPLSLDFRSGLVLRERGVNLGAPKILIHSVPSFAGTFHNQLNISYQSKVTSYSLKMFGLKKSPLHWNARNHSVDPGFNGYSSSNPFDSDNESDTKQTMKPARRTSSEPSLVTPHLSTNPFDDDDDIKQTHSSAYSATSIERNRYNNEFRDSGGFENQTVQELENYAVYKAEETTKAVNNCLKIAEDIRQDATKTVITLHQQGEQITRTHLTAADIEHDLSRGEKLLGTLGGLFSKTWKPKKTRTITGPVITRDDPFQRRGNHLEQREKLGLSSAPKQRSSSRTPPPEPTNALQKVEVEHAKQDDALSDLSNLLGELKHMAIDMGCEIERQNKSLDHFQDDVDELNFRVKGANQRGRRLLGK